ncbi:ATP-binding protein [Nocardiopsis alba]|uniref:ATP-binding protein n=1 Tax=Nocardiopsis alba TaxID=53437 RepID=A0ABV5DSP3_9ACTN
MSIVPHDRAPIHALGEPLDRCRRLSRVYPGVLSQIARVRSDLTTDLSDLIGPLRETGEDVVLCVSEMFANACDHSRSGQDDEGRVIRLLHRPTATSVRVAIVDDGVRTDRSASSEPRISSPRSSGEGFETERGRGLLLIDHLAARWGTRSVLDFPFCSGLGTVTWAEFLLPETAR